METEFVANTIPAGLCDNNIEFMVKDGDVVFIQGGKLHFFNELSVNDISILREELQNDLKAQDGLRLLGISDPIEQLRKFVFCRFGALNNIPDVDHDSLELNNEYWDCGLRPCPADGLLCKFPKVKEKKLTRHEAVIIREIGDDRLNKEIAHDLGISIETVNKECKKIAIKIGCFSSKGIACFAGKNMMF